MSSFHRLAFLLLIALPGFAQPVLRLKTRPIPTSRRSIVSQIDSPVPFGQGHLILQFDLPPTTATLAALAARGVTVLQGIPENGLLVSVSRPVSIDGLGVRYAAPLDPSDKISPLITPGMEYLLVEFHPDVDLNYARSLILGLGIELRENPDLGPRQLLIRTASVAALAILAAQDPVGYIFPASAELAANTPAQACAGPITSLGTVGQYIATAGNGWDGAGRNAATISYVFSRLTDRVPPASAQSEILRAMAEWAKVAKITWQPGSNSNGPRTVNVLFARGDHGDGYPFDGPGRVLAHTFYPAPPNPEPIAGDMHLDDDESWRIGVNTDIYSVSLHELGHALGLGHSDNPNDVMYPYYRLSSTLAAGDKAAILTVYAAQGATTTVPAPTPTPTPAPTPRGNDTTPPTLTITSPGGSTVSTSSAALTFSGTATDNVAVASVTWSTNTGSAGTAGGTARWTASIPLAVGSNTVTIRATDTAGNVAWRSVIVRRF